VVVTADEWENFFSQRCHPDAQPEMRAVADAMRAAYQGSTPIERDHHLPFVGEVEGTIAWRACISAARCARASYGYFDCTSDVEADWKRYKMLISQTPPHAAQLEHIGFHSKGNHGHLLHQPLAGNFVTGWGQLRHSVLGAHAVTQENQYGV